MYYYGQVTGRLEMSITELQQEEGNSLYQVLLSFLILGVFKLYGDTKHKGKKAMYYYFKFQICQNTVSLFLLEYPLLI